MSKKNIQRVLRLVVYPTWTVAAVLFVSFLIVGPLIDYVVPDSVFNWLAQPLGSLTIAAVTYLIATILVLAPLWLLRRMNWTQMAQRIGLAHRPTLRMVPWALLSWGLYFGLTIITTILLSLVHLPGLDLQQQQNVGFGHLTYGYEYIAAFVALVVLAPLFEEIIFRGYLYGRLRRDSSFFLSALLTSSAFALLHFQLNVGIDVFILSLFLCYVREKFDSIWPGVIIHAFKNGIAYLFLFILPLYGVNLLQ